MPVCLAILAAAATALTTLAAATKGESQQTCHPHPTPSSDRHQQTAINRPADVITRYKGTVSLPLPRLWPGPRPRRDPSAIHQGPIKRASQAWLAWVSGLPSSSRDLVLRGGPRLQPCLFAGRISGPRRRAEKPRKKSRKNMAKPRFRIGRKASQPPQRPGFR